MDKTLLLIIIGIFVLLAISLTVTIIVFVKSRKKWKEVSYNQYLKGKEEGKTEAVSIINATINSIESDRNKLNQMSEKELMVSTMMALASYGRRLDETNERLLSITDYKVYISEMNKQMQNISNMYVSLQNTVKTAENSLNDSFDSSRIKLNETADSSRQAIESFNKTANAASENINILNSRLTNVGDIKQRVDEINTDLSQSLGLLTSLQMQSSSIMSEMNEMLESYGQSPIAKLDQINANIDILRDRISELYEKFKYVDSSDLERLEDLEKLEEIRSHVEDIYDKIEYVSSSDLRDLSYLSRLSDLDKLDDIESKLSSIESRLD